MSHFCQKLLNTELHIWFSFQIFQTTGSCFLILWITRGVCFKHHVYMYFQTYRNYWTDFVEKRAFLTEINIINGLIFILSLFYFRTMQEVHLDKHIKLLDSPGIVMATGTSDTSVILRNCVKVRCVPLFLYHYKLEVRDEKSQNCSVI